LRVGRAGPQRAWLLPLVPLYWIGVAVKNLLYERGVLKAKRLARPVISVGSLSAGGAGKTPVVIALARLCEQHHRRVDGLSRGYGRRSAGEEQVEFNYFASAARFGDEPVEMMRAGLHVFVGGDRYRAGALAEATHEAYGHLLDDGFQHRRLARDLEIVLLTSKDVDDFLLPAGDLREPLSSLGRADVVVLREEEAEGLRSVVRAHSSAEIWVIRRELVFEEEFARPFVFCGIARPQGFLAMVREAGYTPAGTMLFADHHAYTEADLDRIVENARAVEADGIYLTEKDAVKLPKEWVQRLQMVGPVHAPYLRVSLMDTKAAMTRLLGVLGDE
jgi:tetraacyldisaccharide 4'-kinase